MWVDYKPVDDGHRYMMAMRSIRNSPDSSSGRAQASHRSEFESPVQAFIAAA